MPVNQFRAFTKDATYLPVSKSNTSKLIMDTPLYEQGRNGDITGYNIAGVATNKFGGGKQFSKSDIQGIYNKIMDGGNRETVVNDLINTWKKIDSKSINGEMSKNLRQLSKDSSVRNTSLLKFIPKEVLLKNL
jgi:hypothetical protein